VSRRPKDGAKTQYREMGGPRGSVLSRKREQSRDLEKSKGGKSGELRTMNFVKGKRKIETRTQIITGSVPKEHVLVSQKQGVQR